MVVAGGTGDSGGDGGGGGGAMVMDGKLVKVVVVPNVTYVLVCYSEEQGSWENSLNLVASLSWKFYVFHHVSFGACPPFKFMFVVFLLCKGVFQLHVQHH